MDFAGIQGRVDDAHEIHEATEMTRVVFHHGAGSHHQFDDAAHVNGGAFPDYPRTVGDLIAALVPKSAEPGKSDDARRLS
jgi:hypothetical protein